MHTWVERFERRRRQRPSFATPGGTGLSVATRRELARSLARFQIGESGEGKCLLRGAARHGDPHLTRAMGLFVAEEQGHAALLAQVIDGLGGQLLTSHWTDRCFIVLRRCAGFRGELLVLLIAEILGLLYYATLRDRLGDPQRDRVGDPSGDPLIDERVRPDLARIFASIHDDEVEHLAFHLDWLGPKLRRYSPLVRWFAKFTWGILFRCACRVLVWDHRGALRELGVPRRQFRRRAGELFDQIAGRLFDSSALTAEDHRILEAFAR